MTPAELRAARQRLNLTQPALAELLGVNWRTLAGWEAGRRNGQPALVPKAIELAIQAIERRK